MEFTVHEAKTQFSKLMKHALAGEEVVITSGKARTPSVKLVPCNSEPERKPIRMGWLKGKLGDIGPDHPFFDPLPEEELRAWEGGDE